MDLAQVEEGIIAYIDNEVIPAMKGNPWKQGLTIAVILQAKSSGTVSQYFEMMSQDTTLVALGVITEDGKIGCLDTIAKSLKGAMEQTGPIVLPVLDVSFNQQDVDTLVKYIKGAAGNTNTLSP